MDVRYGFWIPDPESTASVLERRIEWVPGVLISADANTCMALVADKETGQIFQHHIGNVRIIT